MILEHIKQFLAVVVLTGATMLSIRWLWEAFKIAIGVNYDEDE